LTLTGILEGVKVKLLQTMDLFVAHLSDGE